MRLPYGPHDRARSTVTRYAFQPAGSKTSEAKKMTKSMYAERKAARSRKS